MNDKSPPDFKEPLPEQPKAPDRKIVELEKALSDEINARKEERFIFAVVSILLLDVVFFSVLDGWGGPIALVVVELLLLVLVARRMGVEAVSEFLDGVLGRIISGVTNRK